MNAMNNNVAVLGLGIIGSQWAAHYETAKRLAASWNRSPRQDAPMAVAQPAEAARRAGIVQIVVSDPAAVESVIGGILPELGPGHLVIQSSTIDPASAKRFAVKDMRLALGAGRAAALPLTNGVEGCLERAHANGWGDLDFSALCRNLFSPG